MTHNTHRHPISIPYFRAYLIGRLSMILSQYSMMLVIGWQTYNIARETMSASASAAQLGFIGLAQFIPIFLLTPIAGWIADHHDRRYIARGTLALQILCAAVLALATYEGWISLPLIFSIAALLGVVRAFSGPALSALAPNLVPREVLPNAIAISSVAWQSGMIIGPAVGGYVYAVAPTAAYCVSVGLFSLALLCLFLIGKVPRPQRDITRHPIMQMVDGLAYVRRNRLVLATITLDLFAVLLAGATALLPVYARDILHVGSTGLGHLAAAPAIGAGLTALWFSFRPLKREVGLKMLGAVVVFGVATVTFGLSTWIPLSLGCLVVLGSADMFSVYIRQSLIQLHTPDEMRGLIFHPVL
ncbi:MAG: MFS transporter [Alphaproteobacteria bacterium]|nr:MFS transporter [Alphaproteobacteria bacterium]